MNANREIVSLTNVIKNYGHGEVITKALQGIDLKINQEDFSVIMGPSGCGKSTMLNIIGGLDKTTSGEVKFDGKGCAICMACTSVLTEMIKGKNLEEVKNFKKDDLLSELGLGHLIKTSPVRIKCALLSLKALKYGIYSYFVDKMNDVEAAGKLKEEAASLY